MITTTTVIQTYILLVTAVVAAAMVVIVLFVVLFVVAAGIFMPVRKLQTAQKPPCYSIYNYLIIPTYRNFRRPAIPPPNCGPF